MHRARTAFNILTPAGQQNFGSWLVRQQNSKIANDFVAASAVKSYNSAAAEPFLNGSSSAYVEEMYNAWLRDPNSVHASWDAYFRNNSYSSPPTLAPPTKNHIPASQYVGSSLPAVSGGYGGPALGGQVNDKLIDDHLAVQAIIRSYQSRGHLMAAIDPLGILNSETQIGPDGIPRRANEKVTRNYMQFGEQDMDRSFKLPSTTFIGGKEKYLPLREILNRLENAYCNKIGVEFMFINSLEQCNWIREKFESPNAIDFSHDEKRLIMARLTRATGFESFLSKKFSSEKRFGLEGCEILIPAMKEIIDSSTRLGVESIVMGMPHRGRLNVLANVCRKPLHQMFTQFAGLEAADDGSGDVKYHLGTYIERLNRVTNKNIRLAVVANPSHLEACDPVVQGKTRAEQFYRGDNEGKKVMSILLHGDAAFSGQGVVFETMHLSELPDYTTRLSTTKSASQQIPVTRDHQLIAQTSPVSSTPQSSTSTQMIRNQLCTSAALLPSGEQPSTRTLLSISSATVAMDTTSSTSRCLHPLMYKRIRQTKPVLDLYAEQLIKEGVVTAEEVKSVKDKYTKICEEAFEQAKVETHVKYKDWLDSPWSGFFEGKDPLKVSPTGVPEETLIHIGNRFSSPPPNAAEFIIHKGLLRVLASRKDMVDARVVDWAMAEAMAFGSLMREGIHVRLSGQDVERGTFSHRHHVLHHQEVDKATYRPLNHLYPDQAPYTVCNSSLSEYGVLGFELGYSMTNPNALVCWEAQFGDFNNTAQCIIDQFISSGQAKWVRQSGLVMLLPHGMEGMGPEHSSARLERFLQMSSDDPDYFPPESDEFAIRQLHDINWIVANCSTPANYFHILRRQIAMPFRKPLVVMTPKSLLRHPECKSNFSEMVDNTEFKRVIAEKGPAAENPSGVKRLIFCSGRVYYDLIKARREKGLDNEIAISTVEQITPFPYDLVRAECAKYPNAEICWAQEEHKNQGAWNYVLPRFNTSLNASRGVGYASTDDSITNTETTVKNRDDDMNASQKNVEKATKRKQLEHKEKSFWRSWFSFGALSDDESDTEDEKRNQKNIDKKIMNNNSNDRTRGANVTMSTRKSSACSYVNFNAPSPDEAKYAKAHSSSSYRALSYIGRPCAASTATGSKAQHIRELNNFLTEATTL